MEAKRPHIIIVSEKWCDGRENLGPSPSEHSFWGPLEYCQSATFSLFHFDEHYSLNKMPGDSALIELCKKEKPDLIFLIWLYSERHHVNPTFDSLYYIRYKLGIPIISWWGDTHADFLVDLAEMIDPYCTRSLSGDSSQLYLTKVKNRERYYPLPHPKDPRVFCDPGLERDIEVSFIGTMRGDRAQRMQNLRELGVEVFQTGGQREAKLSISEYARYLQRSKMTISFVQYSGIEYPKIDGRIFEATLCGALLFEPAKSDAPAWFEPMKEYVPYNDDKDLADKIKYYAAHPEERKEIAERGRQRSLKCYTGEAFWCKVIELAKENSTATENEALYALALYWFNRKNIPLAQDYLKKLYSLDRSFPNYYILGAKICNFLGNREQVLQLTDRARELIQPEPSIYCELSSLYFQNQSRDQAFDLLQQGLSKFPGSLKIISALTKNFPDRIDHLQILNLCQQELIKNPGSPEIQRDFATIMLNLNYLDQAVQLVNSAYECAADKGKFLMEIGDWWHSYDQKEKAKEAWWQGLSPKFQKEHAWSVLPEAITLQYQGHWEKAERLIKYHLPFVKIEEDLLIEKLFELRSLPEKSPEKAI